MKRKLIGVYLTSTLIAACAPTAYAQTVYYSGPQGQSLGYSQTVGNTTYYTGPQGQALGYSQQMQPGQQIQQPVMPQPAPVTQYAPPPVTRPAVNQVNPFGGLR